MFVRVYLAKALWDLFVVVYIVSLLFCSIPFSDCRRTHSHFCNLRLLPLGESRYSAKASFVRYDRFSRAPAGVALLSHGLGVV